MPLPFLIIEVSNKTYQRDSGIKLRKYAQAGIADYWIFNLRADRIELYREPWPAKSLEGCRYASVTHFVRGQRVGLLKRPEMSFLVDDLLPDPESF